MRGPRALSALRLHVMPGVGAAERLQRGGVARLLVLDGGLVPGEVLPHAAALQQRPAVLLLAVDAHRSREAAHHGVHVRRAEEEARPDALHALGELAVRPHRVLQPAGGVHYRHGAVAHRIQLRAQEKKRFSVGNARQPQ